MKKTVKILALMLAFMMLLTSCGSKISKEDADAMAGKWQLVLYDYYGVKMIPSDADTYMAFEFKDNGKTTFTLDEETEDYKWEKDGDLVTVWVKDGAVSRGKTAVVEGDMFTLYWDYNGEPVTMIYAREGTDAVNPDLYITEDDVTSTMIKNADESNILEIMEKMTPKAREVFELTDVYNQLKGE